MSTYIPPSLRNEATSELERELSRRDGLLAELDRTVAELRGQLGELSVQEARLAEQLSHVKEETRSTRQALDRQQLENRLHVALIHARIGRQRRQILRQIEETEARQRARIEESDRQLEQVRNHLMERASQQRTFLASLTGDARRTFAEIPRGRISRLDLEPDSLGLHSRLDALPQAETVAEEELSQAVAEVVLVAGEVQLFRSLLDLRDLRIQGDQETLRADLDQVRAALGGEPVLGLPEQRELVARYLGPERMVMGQMLEEYVARRIRALDHWTVRVGAIEEIRGALDFLLREICQARLALSEAVAHDEARVDIGHIAQRLEDEFAELRLPPDGEPGGRLTDPDDGKSIFLWYVDTSYGEIVVQAPWLGSLEVRGGGRALQLPSAVSQPSEEATLLGHLKERWLRQQALWLHPEARQRTEGV